jgi:hypothetical protein
MTVPPLAAWLRLGGVLQLVLLIASALVPTLFDWRTELAKLSPFVRRLFWVYGGYVVLMMVALGLVSIVFADTLAAGDPLARAVTSFIAVFWLARLGIQWFVFNVKPYVGDRPLVMLGYHGLTLIFVYLVAVFGYATLAGAGG